MSCAVQAQCVTRDPRRQLDRLDFEKPQSIVMLEHMQRPVSTVRRDPAAVEQNANFAGTNNDVTAS